MEPKGHASSRRRAVRVRQVSGSRTSPVKVHDYGVVLFALSDRNDVMWVYKPSGAPCP